MVVVGLKYKREMIKRAIKNCSTVIMWWGLSRQSLPNLDVGPSPPLLVACLPFETPSPSSSYALSLL